MNNATPELARSIVERIVKEIALHTNDVRTSLESLGRVWMINVQVNRGDMPRIIGKGGAHSQALSTIIAAIAAKTGEQIRLSIVEPAVGVKDRYPSFAPNFSWNAAPAMTLLSDICDATLPGKSTIRNLDSVNMATVLEVRVDPRVRFDILRGLQSALNTLFNAIGKANGRLLTVELLTPSESNEQAVIGRT